MNLGLFGFQKCDKGFVGVSLALTPLTETGGHSSRLLSGLCWGTSRRVRDLGRSQDCPPRGIQVTAAGPPLLPSSPLHPSGFSEWLVQDTELCLITQWGLQPATSEAAPQQHSPLQGSQQGHMLTAGDGFKTQPKDTIGCQRRWQRDKLRPTVTAQSPAELRGFPWLFCKSGITHSLHPCSQLRAGFSGLSAVRCPVITLLPSCARGVEIDLPVTL